MKSDHSPHLFCFILAALAAISTTLTSAAIRSGYVADANTLHLWHLDEADPDPASPDLAVTGSFDLLPVTGAALGAASFAGFGSAGDTSVAEDAGFQGATIPVSAVTGADGAFTFEAIIRPAEIDSIQQLITMDRDALDSERPFQFRIDAGNLRLVNIGAASGLQQILTTIPTDGPDAFVADEWFHVAVTYNGSENTPDNVKLYWTRLDAAKTQANEILSTSMVDDLAGGESTFGVASEYRPTGGFTGNLEGQIDEVRISDIARAPGEFIFFTPGADADPPQLRSTTPADNAEEVRISGNLVASFDEIVEAGAAGNITLKQADTNMTVEEFGVTDSDRITFDGGNVIIDPSSDLVGGVEYYVLIDTDAITDVSGNGSVGIDDPTAWSFTADGNVPTVVSMEPIADASGLPQATDLSLSFSEPVSAASGNLTVHLADGGSMVEVIDVLGAGVTIDGTDVSIDLSELAPATAYYINIAAGAFTDLSGNDYAGIGDATTWAFTTAAIADGLLFSHNFGGDSADIDGTTPDITTGGAIWVASPIFNQDGSIDQVGAGGSATLIFTPTNGLIYTLEASLRGVNGDGDWFALGFANGQSTGSTSGDRFINNNVVGKAWMLLKGDAAPTRNSALMNGTASNEPLTAFTNENPGGDMDMRIVLDTTGGNGTWTATWYAKRPADTAYTEVRATAVLLAEDINSVGLAVSNLGVFGSIESFRLFTGAEPSEKFAIREIGYSPVDNTVTLTWDSTEGADYIIKFSTDMSNWENDLDDSVQGDAGDMTTRSYPLGDNRPDKIFFRVERL